MKIPLTEAQKRLVGLPVSAIDTPALVVDIDALQRNLTRMADFARKHDIRWRPHAKTHKSSSIAKLQMQAGAVGICVQKTSEAEAMAEGGVKNIYITNEVIAPVKLQRVAILAHWLAGQQGQLSIAVDSAEGVRRLAHAMDEQRGGGVAAVVDVFVELDVGQGRCGVPPGRQALDLVLEIRKHPALRFAGLQAYQGRAQHMRTPQERRDAISVVVQDVLFARKLIEAESVPVELITGAGTGSMVCEAASGVFGELQAGSFVFMDGDYANNERDPAQPQFEHALFVKSQVISSGPRHAVCDAGHKAHAIDSGLPKVVVREPTGALNYANGGDEHGILRPAAGNQRVPELGEDIWLIPGHCDPTVNLHNVLIGISGGLENGQVERIIRVDARGALT